MIPKADGRVRGGTIAVDEKPAQLFSYVDLERRIAPDYPLRAIRALVDKVLAGQSRAFTKLYARDGRPGIPPERLLRALLLLALLQRALRTAAYGAARLQSFVSLVRGPIRGRSGMDATVFCKNRDRLLRGDVAAKFILFALPRLVSSGHARQAVG